jgi:hypothetical protein
LCPSTEKRGNAVYPTSLSLHWCEGSLKIHEIVFEKYKATSKSFQTCIYIVNWLSYSGSSVISYTCVFFLYLLTFPFPVCENFGSDPKKEQSNFGEATGTSSEDQHGSVHTPNALNTLEGTFTHF